MARRSRSWRRSAAGRDAPGESFGAVVPSATHRAATVTCSLADDLRPTVRCRLNARLVGVTDAADSVANIALGVIERIRMVAHRVDAARDTTRQAIAGTFDPTAHEPDRHHAGNKQACAEARLGVAYDPRAAIHLTRVDQCRQRLATRPWDGSRPASISPSGFIPQGRNHRFGGSHHG
jgi:hypothetical protein